MHSHSGVKRRGQNTAPLLGVCREEVAWTCSRSGDQGSKGNSTLPASSLLWAQVVRTPDLFTSPLSVTGFYPPPPPRVPGQRGEIEARKEGSAGLCQCVKYICLDGLRRPPSHSQSLPASATNQAAPTSGYLCRHVCYIQS